MPVRYENIDFKYFFLFLVFGFCFIICLPGLCGPLRVKELSLPKVQAQLSLLSATACDYMAVYVFADCTR